MSQRRHGICDATLFTLAIGACVPAHGDTRQLPGGIDLDTSVSVDYQYDDNVTNAAEEVIESRVVATSAEFAFEAVDRTDVYSVAYSVEHNDYLESETDNFTDHALDTSSNWEFGSRLGAELRASYAYEHEGRGSGFSQGFGNSLDEPERYQAGSASVLLNYGLASSPLRFEVLLGGDSRKYDGFEIRQRNRKGIQGSLTSYFSIGARTDLLVEINGRDIDYLYNDSQSSLMDSRDTDYLVGLEWESAKTELSLRGGRRTKEFTDSGRNDFSGPRWLLEARWKPLSYSTIELATERTTAEPQGLGDYIELTSNTCNWQHNWSERFSSSISYTAGDRKSYGMGEVLRSDKRRAASLDFSYQMRNWVSLSLGAQWREQVSSNESLDYSRNITYFGVQLSI